MPGITIMEVITKGKLPVCILSATMQSISIHFVTGTYDLLTLAKSIDQDIINGASYLKIGDTISPPVIQSLDVSKPDLREGKFHL